MKRDNWIKDAVKNPGALHRDLNVAPGKKIPIAKERRAANGKDETLRKRAQFALNVRKIMAKHKA